MPRSTKHLTKPYFDDIREVWAFLQREVNGRRRFSKSQIRKITRAVETGRATARIFTMFQVAQDIAARSRSYSNIDFIPLARGAWLSDEALQRVATIAADLEPIARHVAAAVSASRALSDDPNRRRPVLSRRTLRRLSGELQLMAAFAVRAAERVRANRPEPAEMEAFVLLAGLRGRPEDELGSAATPRRINRKRWKDALRSARAVLTFVDSVR